LTYLAVIRYAKIHGTRHRPWLTALLARRPTKVAAMPGWLCFQNAGEYWFVKPKLVLNGLGSEADFPT
jgi:hypothetical protein